MDRLPPIPTPPSQRWREFRIQFVPVLVFLASIAAVVLVWDQHVSFSTLQGEVETRRANVTSPQPGTLSELKVERFQSVKKGDLIAVVIPRDPRSALALLQSEMDALRARIEPNVTQQRNATDYERLRLEWLVQRVELAEARYQLQLAENELKRSETLFKEKIIAESLYDLALKAKQGLEAAVAQRSALIDDVERSLSRLNSLNDLQNTNPGDATAQTLRAFEKRIADTEAALGPITLSAPISGMISSVYRQPGETVMDGDPIVSIASPESSRIVGYLRQPYSIEPEVGMAVEIITRSSKRQSGIGKISQIGLQVEPITNSLAVLRPGMIMDVGLPIEVTLPAELRIRPGELVDMIVHPDSK